MRGAPIHYTETELAWIKKHATLPRRESHAKFCARFGRDDVSLENYKNLCTRKGWKTGRTGRYDNGHVQDNKGKKMPYNPNSAATRFKEWQKPHNTK